MKRLLHRPSVYIGEDGNLLVEDADNCKVLKIRNPILTDTDMLKIKYINKEGFKSEVLPITYYKNTSLKKALVIFVLKPIVRIKKE